MIPLDIDLPSLWAEQYDHARNETILRANLDLLKEIREQASIRMANYQQKTTRYYNSRVKHKSFKVSDLILRRVEASQLIEVSKLSLKWEGPYQVSKVVRLGAYQLRRMDDSNVPKT